MVRLVFIYKTRGKYSNALYSMLNMLMSIQIKVLI